MNDVSTNLLERRVVKISGATFWNCFARPVLKEMHFDLTQLFDEWVYR